MLQLIKLRGQSEKLTKKLTHLLTHTVEEFFIKFPFYKGGGVIRRHFRTCAGNAFHRLHSKIQCRTELKYSTPHS